MQIAPDKCCMYGELRCNECNGYIVKPERYEHEVWDQEEPIHKCAECRHSYMDGTVPRCDIDNELIGLHFVRPQCALWDNGEIKQ
jgi:hypothetical protein